MENHEIIKLTARRRTLIFISLVVSGIASSTLATAMTTALPSLVEYLGLTLQLDSGSPAVTLWLWE